MLEQPSGGSETGKYILNAASYANNAIVGDYIDSISRTSTPISVTKDTADIAPSNCVSVSTSLLSANGFAVSTAGSGTFLQIQAAGNWTLNY